MRRWFTLAGPLVFCIAVPPAIAAAQQPSWPTSDSVVAGADQGDATAQAWLGVFLITGDGQRRDERAGVEWIRKSATAGNAFGQRLLADILSTGKLVKKDDATAIEWYHRSAKGGDADSQSELGVRYTRGWGVPVDDAEAVRWELKAAAAGDIASMMYLAARYESGKGVDKNHKTAVGLFQQAAILGSAQAMCYVGDMYRWGAGVEKSPREAYRWYSAAFAATPQVRPIRPVNQLTLIGDIRRKCEAGRKEAAKALSSDERAAEDRAAREWLATVRYQRIP